MINNDALLQQIIHHVYWAGRISRVENSGESKKYSKNNFNYFQISLFTNDDGKRDADKLFRYVHSGAIPLLSLNRFTTTNWAKQPTITISTSKR